MPAFDKAENRGLIAGFHHRGAVFAPKGGVVHGFARPLPKTVVQARTATANAIDMRRAKKMAPEGAMREARESRSRVR